LTLETAEETLRCCSRDGDISHEGHVYEKAPDNWRVSGEISGSNALVPEPLRFAFDGGEADDDATFVGKLLDNTWHQRPARFIGLLLNPDRLEVIDTFFEWRGKMDKVGTTEQIGAPSMITLSCEGGTFRALERNFSTCSDQSQRLRNTGDTFFSNTGVKPSQQIPFGTKWVNVPGHAGASSGGSYSGILGQILNKGGYSGAL
jgi:hypothetical protein